MELIPSDEVPGVWTSGCSTGVAMGGTHVDEVVPVANEKVSKNACLVEVPQADHVLHTVH